MTSLVLCWAITTHKAQGATIACVVLDVGVHGQHLGMFFVREFEGARIGGFGFCSPSGRGACAEGHQTCSASFPEAFGHMACESRGQEVVALVGTERGVPPGDAAREPERTLMPLPEQPASTWGARVTCMGRKARLTT